MTGPITIQIKPGSAVVNEKLAGKYTARARISDCLPEVSEIGKVAMRHVALRFGMKKWVVSVKEPFPASEVARTLTL